ncbi:MAG: hypothetical protein PVI40_07525 [Chlamydiota bacterium]|jgi:hypothetical protein|nr:MAG: hypothetical protein COT84_05650 [Chlamydiae bacterium CG10_big_fil_rev_8_21_14_0_10_35_9]
MSAINFTTTPSVNNVEENNKPTFKDSTSFKIAKVAYKLAIPFAVLSYAQSISTVNATPFTDCIDSCRENANGAHPIAVLLCQTMCWILTGGK